MSLPPTIKSETLVPYKDNFESQNPPSSYRLQSRSNSCNRKTPNTPSPRRESTSFLPNPKNPALAYPEGNRPLAITLGNHFPIVFSNSVPEKPRNFISGVA
ncbi:hypothetical protein JTE90_010639 [Oedothorax gibbosus]|uniref:Uncharacterized protein n=1 Tax=Oedothorax gibbosus TaxID=931172 RepID=A0AAV6VI12_9ARAC|nr:hypothetical protein JTE90_010639 [Oedothorax gibbosus]